MQIIAADLYIKIDLLSRYYNLLTRSPLKTDQPDRLVNTA